VCECVGEGRNCTLKSAYCKCQTDRSSHIHTPTHPHALLQSQLGSKDVKAAAIIPAFNEAARLGAVLEPLLAAGSVDEIVVVDDGSADTTAEVVRAFGERSARVRLLRLPENRGKGGAMHSGALNTDAETILFLDADLI